jgi:AraC-like DNA-binding protein
VILEISLRAIDSPLGAWTHAEARPARLAGVVESIWYFDGFVAERRERVFPSGVIELIVHLGERYELVERCQAAPTAEASIEVAATWVEARVAGVQVAGGRVAEPRVAWIAGEIERHAGAISIGRLRERAGLTKTRLAAGFREQVGVTPKVYARIRRFHHALGLLHRSTLNLVDDGVCDTRAGSPDRPSLSRLALNAGYYDQPHVNAVAGQCPSAVPAETFFQDQRLPLR